MAGAEQRAGVGVGVEALLELERRLGPADDLAGRDVVRRAREAHAAMPAADGFDVAAPRQFGGDLHQMRLRDPVRARHLIHGDDSRRP
jgi:hypothetical protein